MTHDITEGHILTEMVHKLLLLIALAASLISPELPGASATKTKAQVKNNSGVTPAGQCGTWVKEPDGGFFTSPNYPEKYPPERECVYIIEASPRQCIDLFFDEKYSIEPSWECKFDHIEARDGPFGFSPIIGRFCGQESPAYVRSSGRYLYIKFVADGELEAIGFSARYNFTQDPEFQGLGELPALPFCEFELSGPEGFVESTQISGEGRALLTEAVDCRWYIKAPPRSRVCICQTVVGLMCWWWWCYVCLLFVAVTVWSVETDEGIKYYVHFHLLSQSADSRVWKYSTTSRLKAICIISRLYIHVYSISVFE